MRNDDDLIGSFNARVPGALVFYAGRALAAALVGDKLDAEQLRYRELHLAFERINRLGCTLTTMQKTRVAAYFFPIIAAVGPLPVAAPEAAPVAPLVGLTFDSLSSKLRGQLSQPLTLTGTVSGALSAGMQLVVTRDGQTIQRVPAAVGAYSFIDDTPGVAYQVSLSGTTLVRRQTRVLISPILYGTLAQGATATQLRTLTVSTDTLTDGRARFAVNGTRTRIQLAVPIAQGRVTRLSQPNDNDRNITVAFTSRLLALDFGADGVADYEVFESTADFIGPFTFDAHLV